MRLFGRKKDKTPEKQATQTLQPGADELAPGIVVLPNGDVTLKPNSVAEAKLGIKQLQLKKKEYAAEKRLLSTRVAERQAARRMETAQQGSKMHGGGKLGTAVRGLQTAQRDKQRLQHTAALAPLEHMKRDLEYRTIAADRAIVMLQKFILESSENA
jgi:hypothetical protein